MFSANIQDLLVSEFSLFAERRRPWSSKHWKIQIQRRVRWAEKLQESWRSDETVQISPQSSARLPLSLCEFGRTTRSAELQPQSGLSGQHAGWTQPPENPRNEQEENRYDFWCLYLKYPAKGTCRTCECSVQSLTVWLNPVETLQITPQAAEMNIYIYIERELEWKLKFRCRLLSPERSWLPFNCCDLHSQQ